MFRPRTPHVDTRSLETNSSLSLPRVTELHLIYHLEQLNNPEITFFLHQRYKKLRHSKVWSIQTREVNTAFSSHNVTGLSNVQSFNRKYLHIKHQRGETRIKLYLLLFPVPFPSFIYALSVVHMCMFVGWGVGGGMRLQL